MCLWDADSMGLKLSFYSWCNSFVIGIYFAANACWHILISTHPKLYRFVSINLFAMVKIFKGMPWWTMVNTVKGNCCVVRNLIGLGTISLHIIRSCLQRAAYPGNAISITIMNIKRKTRRGKIATKIIMKFSNISYNIGHLWRLRNRHVANRQLNVILVSTGMGISIAPFLGNVWTRRD